MEDRDFLLQLMTHPHDDAVRQAYADWLEEQGNPGAEYLRAEMELAELSPEDARYASLQYRLQGLRTRCDPRWVACAGQRYDLRLLNFPQGRIQSAAERLGALGVLTHFSARFKLSSIPSTIVADVPRAKAEQVARELERVAGKEQAEPGIKLQIVRSRDRTAGE